MSISTASGAIAICAASRLSRQACSRLIVSTVAAGSAVRSALRRCARHASAGGEVHLDRARAARRRCRCPVPSATIPAPAATASAMISRCMPISTLAHLRDRRDRADGVGDLAGPDRAGHVLPVDGDLRAAGSVPTMIRGSVQARQHRLRIGELDLLIGAATRSAPGTWRRCPDSAARARRRRRRAAVDLPEPDGPSIAITRPGLAAITLHFVHAGRYHPGG